MNEVWVVCLRYDYGVISWAGFFSSRREAERWIQDEIIKEKKQFDLFLEDEPDWDEDFHPSKFYPVKLELNQDYSGGCLANGCPFETRKGMKLNGPCRCFECKICGGGTRAKPHKHREWCWINKI